MLKKKAARKLAEQEWGELGTSYRRTNRKGAFYFHCSRHGGYVVDSRCLSDEENHKISALISSDKVTLWLIEGKEVGVKGPNTIKPFKVPVIAEREEIFVYFLEEDLAYEILEENTNIRRKKRVNY